VRRTIAVLTAVAAAVTTASSAQPAGPGADHEIRAIERQWNDARAHADIATLDRILVDDWPVTHANGVTDTKAKYLADLKSGTRKFAGGVNEDDLTIRVYGDTAVVAGSSNSTVQYNGQPQGGALRFTRVYIRRGGAWTMIVSHATTRQPPGAPAARIGRRGVEP